MVRTKRQTMRKVVAGVILVCFLHHTLPASATNADQVPSVLTIKLVLFDRYFYLCCLAVISIFLGFSFFLSFFSLGEGGGDGGLGEWGDVVMVVVSTV